MGLVTYTHTIANGGACDGDQVMQDFNDVKAVVEALDESNLVSTAMIGQFHVTGPTGVLGAADITAYSFVAKGGGLLTNFQARTHNDFTAGAGAAAGNLILAVNGTAVATLAITDNANTVFDSGDISVAYNNGDVISVGNTGGSTLRTDTIVSCTIGIIFNIRCIQQKG